MIRRMTAMAAAGLLLASPAAATPWTVDGDTSRLGFVGTQVGTPFEGAFTRFDAEILFDPDDLENAVVTVVIDVASFDSGSAERDDTAMGSEWFDSETFPEARFETSGFTATGDGAYEATASLTIRDVSQSLVLPFTLTIDGDTARMSGEVPLDRRDFDLGTGQWAGADLVGHDVTVTVDLTAVRAP